MGKKTKEHRAKVAKRNKRIAQEKYSIQRQMNKLFEERLENVKNDENINVKIGDKEIDFETINDNSVFGDIKTNENIEEKVKSKNVSIDYQPINNDII